MKKRIIFTITFFAVGLIVMPQVQAQNQQQLEEIVKVQEDFLAGKITYAEYQKLLIEIHTPKPEKSYDPSKLIAPAGKAWIIQDNQVQGSGKAIVFVANGGFEGYERRLGVWGPNRNNWFSKTTYTADENMIKIRSDDESYKDFSGDYWYTISDDGSELALTFDDKNGRGGAAGTYSLRDTFKVQAPGGNIVNPVGTAWEDNWRRRSHDIYHTDGIRYCFGGSGAEPWDFSLDIWNTYTVNSSTGSIILYYHDNRNNKPEDFSYSVTDFGGGNKTLRMWRADRMFPHDEVYKLVPVPSGFQLPKVR